MCSCRFRSIGTRIGKLMIFKKGKPTAHNLRGAVWIIEACAIAHRSIFLTLTIAHRSLYFMLTIANKSFVSECITAQSKLHGLWLKSEHWQLIFRIRFLKDSICKCYQQIIEACAIAHRSIFLTLTIAHRSLFFMLTIANKSFVSECVAADLDLNDFSTRIGKLMIFKKGKPTEHNLGGSSVTVGVTVLFKVLFI
jgi:hypothetical protein